MDENTWRFAQLMMWVIGAQTAFLTAIIGFVWNNLSKRMDKFEHRLDNIEIRLIDIDKRVTVIETVLQMKECCMLKDEQRLKKAE